MRSILVWASVAGCILSLAPSAVGQNSNVVKELFANPTRDYATAPLWVWSDKLTDENVLGSLRDLAAQNVKQAFVHPRPGLITPYLEDEWFRLWKLALAEAEKLDMNLWIYDENSYPSGFAGGLVPEAMPESRGRGLTIREAKQRPAWSDDMKMVFVRDGDAFRDVTADVRDGKAPDAGDYVTAQELLAPETPWNAGKWYVDLLRPGVTEKFIEITLKAYKREIGHEFGRRVPGVFTDEPNLIPAGGLPWTPGLPEAFQKRWGYSLVENLPRLQFAIGDWKRVRHNYYQLLSELYQERWGKPYHDWCEANKLEFTGHYWEHDWPLCRGVPDNMAMYAWHQRPAIDILLNMYSEGLHAQFGNVRAVRELASVANQLNRKRTLCEAYGAAGWDLRFEDMKRIGDWLYVLGVNTMDEHISDISIRGSRKHDHPQVFSYQEPWWDMYHVSATYFARLSAAMSSGEQRNRIVLLEPTTTAWMYNNEGNGEAALQPLGSAFETLIRQLESSQVEYDIGCEEIMARHGGAKGRILGVGARGYETVILPPGAENLNGATVKLLDTFLRGGGTVLCAGEPPSRVDGAVSDKAAALASVKGWKRVDAAAIPAMLQSKPGDEFAIVRTPGDKGILLHHRRHVEDGDIAFLVNTSIQDRSTGTVHAVAGGVEKWDPHTGKSERYAFTRDGEHVEAAFDLPPCGSLLLFVPEAKCEPGKAPSTDGAIIRPDGEPTARRCEPNVLTLDYLDLATKAGAHKGVHMVKAATLAFQANGLKVHPWDRSVQLHDSVITKTFPAGSGFEATYRFTIEQEVPKSLCVVIERPDLYTIACNGQAVSAMKGEWWVDRQFGKVDIAAAAKVGENTVTLKASPMTMMHELAAAYVLGDFNLKLAAAGFVIVPAQPLKLGKWNEQGCPLYGHGVAYTERFDVTSPAGRYFVHMPAWYGSIAKVSVNGKPSGFVAYAPWECDVTDAIKAGENRVEVTVIGTLKNTMGPFHNNPPLGLAGPGSWDNAPEPQPAGAKYSTVGYGLFEPFVLKQVKE